MPWTVIYHRAAAEELVDQPEDIRAKLDYIVQLIARFGLERIPAKYARHLQGRLWEFRLKGKDGIARAFTSPRTDSGSLLYGFSPRRRRRRRAEKSNSPSPEQRRWNDQKSRKEATRQAACHSS